MDGFAKAAAVADGVEKHQVECQQRKARCQDERHPGDDADAQAAQNTNTDGKLGDRQGHAQPDGSGFKRAHVHEVEVLFDDESSAHRIHQFERARDDEGQGEKDPEKSEQESHRQASIS